MAYRNITGIFGHEWISDFSVKMILKELPESHYRIWVRFSDSKNDILLKDCTRKERNLDRIIIEYRDGTNRLDPDPFTWHIFSPVDGFELLLDTPFGAKCFFAKRSKGLAWPQTKNEDPKDIKRMRAMMRHKLAEFLDVSEKTIFEEKDAPLKFMVNSMDFLQKEKLIGLIQSLERDGIWMSVNVNFPYCTIDQFQRLDTEIELEKIGKELEQEELNL